MKNIGDLKFDKHNYNKGTERGDYMLEKSIQECGIGRGIVTDKNGVIIGGNKAAAKIGELGFKNMVVVPTDGKTLVVTQRTDLDLEKDDVAKKLAVADNRSSEINLSWDVDTLLQDVQDGLDLSAFWRDDELDELLKEATVPLPGAEENADAAAELMARADEIEVHIKPGDLWALGEHRLLCGDSTKAEDVQRVMGGEKANLVFTDPPYGVSIGDKNKMLNAFSKSGRCTENIEGDTLSPEKLKDILSQAFINTKKIAAGDSCAVFVCSPQGGGLGMMMMMMMAECGLEVRHILNWIKNCATFSMGRLDYDYQHEPILYTWTKTHKRKKEGQFQTSVWTVNKPHKCADHPTMKPVELPENAILNHTDNGDVVFDPFTGSGTTLIACEKNGRRCRGIEISPKYCQVIINRWELYTGKKAELCDGQTT